MLPILILQFLCNVTRYASAPWELHCHDWMTTLSVKVLATRFTCNGKSC